MSESILSLIASEVDTIATIYINGVIIGRTENQFRRYVFSLPQDILLSHLNTITINIQSSVVYASVAATTLSYDIPPDSDPDIQHGFRHRNLIRKEASSFSWDWGPGYAPSGIWNDITIEGISHARLEFVKVTPLRSSFEGMWEVDVTAKIRNGGVAFQTCFFTTHILATDYKHTSKITLHGGDSNDITVTISNVTNVLEWWPRGYGEPHLYNLQSSLTCQQETSTISTTFGFRTVKLVQEQEGGITKGHSFYFAVNDIPIFIKGSNWIPVDAFQDRRTPEVISSLIQSAYDANINLLRNWGGGRYEQDVFYDVADKLGILVWQEFMFAWYVIYMCMFILC